MLLTSQRFVSRTSLYNHPTWLLPGNLLVLVGLCKLTSDGTIEHDECCLQNIPNKTTAGHSFWLLDCLETKVELMRLAHLGSV